MIDTFKKLPKNMRDLGKLMEKIFQSQIEGSDYSLDENKH